MEKRPWAPIIAAPPAHHSSVGVPYWLVKFGIGSWSLIGIGIVISAIVLILGSVYQVFLGVFLAFVLTAVLLPAVNWLSHFMPRALATAVAVISGFALFGGLIAYVVSSILHEWNDLARQFSHGVDNIMRLLTDGSLPFTLERSQVFDVLSKALQQGTQYAQNHAGEIAQTVASNAGQVAIILTILALAVFITVFLLASGASMWAWFIALLPSRKQERVNAAAEAGWTAFSGYAAGTVIIAVTNGGLSFIFLWLLDLPLAAPLAVLVMLGTFVPLVGAPIAMFVAMFVGLATDGLSMFIIIGLGIAGIGQIEGHLLQPLIMGKKVSVHPVAVAVGVSAGGFAGGLMGAVIAIPLIAVIWSVFRTLHNPEISPITIPE
ncbi:sporulation integral membrane protein YtvI [Arcanobacterium haemolyticum]|uniref:AI-2E family transporter n=1 Tax=Arcanobacterium haemolyticum TaxID=28264 RepID=UPI000D9A95B0|nr:AI-2E family transporter [Arcanobacterium haemolyticum]SPT76016.1 sporulation integral membrane protein YtvI [Arcanobacterium haemolyticum]